MPQPTLAEMAQLGFSFKDWTLSPTTTVENYYRSFPVTKTNIGPNDQLFFRSYEFGADSSSDKPGDVYQATHLHVPLFNRRAALAKEAITGFNIDKKPSGIEEFGVLNGIPNIVPFKGHRIFSETDKGFSKFSSVTNDVFEHHDDIPRINLPPVPEELWLNLKNGQQLYYFDLSRKWQPFKIQYIYNSKLYFTHSLGSVEIKYRALYFLESLYEDPSDKTYSGRHQIVGFGISASKALRGLGALATFFTDKVAFEKQP